MSGESAPGIEYGARTRTITRPYKLEDIRHLSVKPLPDRLLDIQEELRLLGY